MQKKNSIKSKKNTKKTTSKKEAVLTREEFLEFLRKVSRPIKKGGKLIGAKKSKTSE